MKSPARCAQTLLSVALFVTLLAPAALGQSSNSLRLFLDCERACDRTFIRTEITLVDFVNERTAADVHLMITSERTGSGGQVYSLAFIGQRAFSTLSDTLTYTSLGTNSDDERRRGLTNMIENGLVRYLARTALASTIDVALIRRDAEDEDVEGDSEVDPWDFWVFSIGGNGDFGGEESSNRFNGRGNISANRTTEEWKIRVNANGRYSERNFDVTDDDGAKKTITSTTRSGSVWLLGVKSLTGHWSAGGTVYVNTSSQDNTDYSVTIGPALEYNVFPYAESTRREFTFQYGVRWDHRDYEEITLFGVNAESLIRHSLQAELDVQQPWGDMGFDAEFSHLLSNFNRSLTGSYRLELDGNADIRIARGLSVNFGAGYELIRDQLFLPESDLSEQDILLGTRRLPTGFEFNLRFGFNYRFGSIYNNVVNPRFGF